MSILTTSVGNTGTTGLDTDYFRNPKGKEHRFMQSLAVICTARPSSHQSDPVLGGLL